MEATAFLSPLSAGRSHSTLAFVGEGRTLVTYGSGRRRVGTLALDAFFHHMNDAQTTCVVVDSASTSSLLATGQSSPSSPLQSEVKRWVLKSTSISSSSNILVSSSNSNGRPDRPPSQEDVELLQKAFAGKCPSLVLGVC